MNYGPTSSQYRKINGVPIPQPQTNKQNNLQQQQQRNNPNITSNNSSIQQQQQQQKQQMYIPSSSSLTQTIPTNNPLLPTNSHSHHHHHQPGSIPNQLPTVPQPALMASNSILTLGPFKHRKDLTRESVLSTYQIMGYIAAGTYGKVYKAKLRGNIKKEEENNNIGNNVNGSSSSNTEDLESKTDLVINSTTSSNTSTLTAATTTPTTDSSHSKTKKDDEALPQFYAIKKFKSDNHASNNNMNSNLNMNKNIDNDITHYTGISQSAIREMSICRELNNKNITKLINIILENKSIYMIFEFCEHDLLQIIHYHSHPELKPIPIQTIKSLTWQILNGVTFLHKNWIFHRDLKPANIMVTSNGCVKIGDLGLARKFNNPLQSFYTGDKVVVTIWYRAPELLLGTRHYTPAIDLWAVGCILAELLSLRPIFKGEEAKIDINNKKSVPFQKNQFQKIIEILGTPNLKNWQNLNKYPEFNSFIQQLNQNYSSNLSQWYKMIGGENKQCLELLYGLLKYDPDIRLTADQALLHQFFLELPKVKENAFDGLNFKYPNRKIYFDDNDINQGNNQNNQQNNNSGTGQNVTNNQNNQAVANSGVKRNNNGFDEGNGTKRKRG